MMMTMNTINFRFIIWAWPFLDCLFTKYLILVRFVFMMIMDIGLVVPFNEKNEKKIIHFIPLMNEEKTSLK